MSYLKPILYKVLREYQTQANWSVIDLSKILKPYASEAREQKEILGSRLGGVKKLLKQYLSKMLETSNSQLTQTERQSISRTLINNPIAFTPDFFHRISNPEIQTEDDVRNCLDEFPKKYKNRFETPPVDLSKENQRSISALKHNTINVVNMRQANQDSLDQQASA
ncbi:MAG: hypothetical protein ACKO3R_07070 [bacterium]